MAVHPLQTSLCVPHSIHITDRRANSISYDFTNQKPFDLAHRVAISWAHNITVQLCCRLS